MVFRKDSPLYSTEIINKEGENIMYINYMGAPYTPSIADYPEVMGRTIGSLIENPEISRIIFSQQRNYNYPYEQIVLLSEIAGLYTFLIKQEKVLSAEKLGFFGDVAVIHGQLSYLMNLLKNDPVACYLELKKRIDGVKEKLESFGRDSGMEGYLRLLEKFGELLEKTKLIKYLEDIVDSYAPGDREVYQGIFRADVMPNFTFTRLIRQLPEGAELVDQYEVKGEHGQSTVTILKKKGESKYLYHVIPPEYSLSEEHHMLLNIGRNVLIEHQPKAEEFTNPEKTRSVFFNIARDLLNELSQNKKINLNYRNLNNLAEILVRQTIGFGVIEVLLLDSRLQDIYLNSPISLNSIFVRHSEYGECATNIVPSYEDADSWAAKLRLQSGRPLDEANPVLDSDLIFGKVRARIAAIQNPLSPSGLAYALRRHRDRPWTLPLFINNGMINSFAAGLMSFLVDGGRTLLIAGTRSSGKTSLLGSMMMEIMPKVRTIVIEDTLELPVDSLRKIGYNVQRMKVRSALTESTREVEAAEGIRASLRLGDSALILGEVRSSEAKALYEAMRVGALANVVAGTIHGASPYGVFDRIVNDLQVPITSFKATDLVFIANPIKTPDGLHEMKRIIQLAEVRKHWTRDPEEEKGFVDLLRYNVDKDELEPTEELINGEAEVIKDIAGRVKGWAGNWDAIYDNVLLRGKIKQEIVNLSSSLKKPELMEAEFNALSNDAFHIISDEITEEIGIPSSERVFPAWKNWLVENARKFRI